MAIDIGRRQFIFALGGAAAAWPLAARAQQGERMWRIGVLGGTAADDPQNQARMGAFLQGLQQLGWIDGRSVRIDTRWPAGDAADTRKYAAELVALSPDGSRATNLRRSLHVGFSRKHVSRRKPPRRFGRIADTTTDPESSKSGNGDLQHLREMTLRSA